MARYAMFFLTLQKNQMGLEMRIHSVVSYK